MAVLDLLPVPGMETLLSLGGRCPVDEGAMGFLCRSMAGRAIESFVQADGYWARIPSSYWEDYLYEAELPDRFDGMADGSGPEYVGLPIVLSMKQLNIAQGVFLDLAEALAAKKNAPGATVASLHEAARAKSPARRIGKGALVKWFREKRCPAFDGKEPPNWKECWAAAKEAFPGAHVPRAELQEARREAAPHHWLKTGKGRSA